MADTIVKPSYLVEIEDLGFKYEEIAQYDISELSYEKRVQARDFTSVKHYAPKEEVARYVVQMTHSAFPPIVLERTSVTGIRHTTGAISMARSGADSATSSFFICVRDLPSLDFGGKRNPDGQGFAAFGKVTQGMDVVKRINASRTEGQAIMPPVRILQITRAK